MENSLCDIVILFVLMFHQCFVADMHYVRWDCIAVHCSDGVMMLMKFWFLQFLCGAIFE